MIGLWLFALFWCAVSFTVLSQILKSSTPWGWIAFGIGMTLPGVLLTLGLITAHYQRWRVGRVTLVADPDTVTCGEPFHLRLELARDDVGPRSVRFKLELQQSDDGWNTVRTLEHVGQLHPGLTWASGAIVLPMDAKPSQRGWRWRAVAAIEGFPLASAECIVTVRRAPASGQASPAAVTLDVPRTTATPSAADTGMQAPAGAQETAPGIWGWSQTHGLFQVVGAIFLAAGGFWLWHTLRGTLPDLQALRQGAGLHAVGAVLFQVPFWAAGLAVATVGLGLLSLRFHATARAGSMDVGIQALGRTWITLPVTASDITLLQPAPGVINNGKPMNYTLAARTTTGVVTLPMASRSADGLLPQARWLVAVLGVEGLRFDPVVMNEDEPRAAVFDGLFPADQRQELAGYGRTLKRLMAVCFGLGAVGFALQFLSAWAPR